MIKKINRRINRSTLRLIVWDYNVRMKILQHVIKYLQSINNKDINEFASGMEDAIPHIEAYKDIVILWTMKYQDYFWITPRAIKDMAQEFISSIEERVSELEFLERSVNR